MGKGVRPDLHTREWGRIRLAVLERDGWRCTRCGCVLTPGTGSATVDHIIPRANGGTHALDNLRAMCNHCNSRRGARQARGYKRRAPAANVSRFG